MRQSILTTEQSQFLREEKEALAEIRLALSEMDTPREALATFQDAILQLDELFLIVVVGEFNAGKSALVNALLGEKILPEGTTPTTSQVTLVKWGETSEQKVVDDNFKVLTYPLSLLKELNIVDTPGTNAVIRYHERLTNEFVPRSDLVLFTTSSDHPLTESERQFLERILSWGKKIIFALNKIDIFENDTALGEVKAFISKHATLVLGEPPEIFPVSARLAQRAQSELDPIKKDGFRTLSRMDDLENFITSTLDDAARLNLKINNPLGVAENLVGGSSQSIQSQLDALKEDTDTAAALETVIQSYQNDLDSELGPRLSEVENILHRLEQRGLDFFDSTLRLTNVQNLIRGDKVRAQFESYVLADVPQQIEDQVHRLIDWIITKDLHEWQQIMSYLQRRRSLSLDHIVGDGSAPQESRRRELIDSVGRTVQTIVDTYDRNREASELGSSVEMAVAQTALLEVGAVGLGTLVSLAVLSSSLDITGILAASSLAIVGFFIIPYKRKIAKENFKSKMQELRNKLNDALSTQFHNEAENAISRMKDGVKPYTRYINAEQDRLGKQAAVISELKSKLAVIRARGQLVLQNNNK